MNSRKIRLNTHREGKHQYYSLRELNKFVQDCYKYGGTPYTQIWAKRTFHEPATVHLEVELDDPTDSTRN